MPYQIVRKPHMNRLYITGDRGPISRLLRDMNAREDSAGSWVPLHMEGRLRAALKSEAEYQAQIEAAAARSKQAKSVIPADYRTRHGALLGGQVRINGELVIDEPALDTRSLPWVLVASHESRVRDLTGQSIINGRVQDSDTLYSAVVADGRTIYRISHYASFGDDLRETYYLPTDLWEQMMAAEVRLRGITPESAQKWLDESRGCIGTELYEYAVSHPPIPGAAPARSPGEVIVRLVTGSPGRKTGQKIKEDDRCRRLPPRKLQP